MPKPVWIFIILVLAMTGFDAARPFITGDRSGSATSMVERTEFWTFVAFVLVLGGAILFRRYRGRK
jgi:Ni,Fe-hydrogenase I cytochrome b subunit